MQLANQKSILLPAQRVLGWDVLRGMCALAVAFYHMMYSQNIAEIHTLGSYGVYLFFVLSGASLAYNYIDKIQSGQFSFASFLWVRYLRLAPLYLALMLVALPWKIMKNGVNFELLTAYFLNATFLFGFFNPSLNAVLVGGWSLGIEVIFYLLFPVLMWSFRQFKLAAGVFLLLLAVQIGWIAFSLGKTGDYAQNAPIYFQAPAFIAYFMGGCILGVMKRRGQLQAFHSKNLGPLLLLAGFGLMILINPVQAGDEVTGWRGFVLGLVCFLMVYAATRTPIKPSESRFAKWFGDATYGLYLLHSVLFFGFVLVIFPRVGIMNPVDWPVYVRWLFGFFVITFAFGLALLSERFFEGPLRTRFKPKSRASQAAQGAPGQ